MRSVESGQCVLRAVPLAVGDVLISHPWAPYPGTPNTTDVPRALITVRYVRQWYADTSRKAKAIPNVIWQSLTPEQRQIMRFPIQFDS